MNSQYNATKHMKKWSTTMNINRHNKQQGYILKKQRWQNRDTRKNSELKTLELNMRQ